MRKDLAFKAFIQALRLAEIPKVLGICLGVFLGILIQAPNKGLLFTPQVYIFLLGTGLTAIASFVANQMMEIKSDALMVRTQNRPLVRHRVPPVLGISLAILTYLVGLGLIFHFSGHLAALVNIAIGILYVGVYTPLKKKSSWNTFAGALSGALLPLLGASYWGAAFSWENYQPAILYGIAFTAWQMTHGFALAKLYETDYLRAQVKHHTQPNGTPLWVQIWMGSSALILWAPLVYFTERPLAFWTLEAVFTGLLSFCALWFGFAKPKAQEKLAGPLLKLGLFWVSILPLAWWSSL